MAPRIQTAQARKIPGNRACAQSEVRTKNDIPTPEYFGASRPLLNPGFAKFFRGTANKLLHELKVKVDNGEVIMRDIVPQDTFIRDDFTLEVMRRRRLPPNVAAAYAVGLQAQLDVDKRKAEQLGIEMPEDVVMAQIVGITPSRGNNVVSLELYAPEVIEQMQGYYDSLAPFNIKNFKAPENLDPEETKLRIPIVQSRYSLGRFGVQHIVHGLEDALQTRGVRRGEDPHMLYYGPTEYPLEMVDWMQRAPARLGLES